MTFEDVRNLSDEEAIQRVWEIAHDAAMKAIDVEASTDGPLNWELAGLLEEKLRERFPVRMNFEYRTDAIVFRATSEPYPHRDDFWAESWPPTVHPCRVRVDTFILAFGGAS